MPSTNAELSGRLKESGLREHLQVLRRHISLILVVAVLVPGTALVFSLSADKEYMATAKLLFRDSQFDQKLFGSSILSRSQDPDREAATNVNLVSSDIIVDRASRVLGGRPTPDELRDKVEVTQQGQADVVAVIATDPSPAGAATLANAIAEQYIDFRRDADRSTITEAIDLVRNQLKALPRAERDGAEGRAVQARIAQLRILASLQTGNAELFQPAQPPQEASSPTPARDAVIGLFVGLALGIGLASLFDRLDRRVRNRGDAENILGRPCLGAIPESRVLRSAGGARQLAGHEGEAFRKLRTNLRYFDVDQHVHSLLITSSAPGEGKSTIASCLASTAAASNVRVVLVEADLRRPTLHKVFGERQRPGLSDVLSGKRSLDDVIRRRPLYSGSAAEDGPRLDVIVAGSIPPNPTDLLESERMRDLLAELEQRYELVIVDTSPVTIVPDPIPIMACVSGVMIVVREGRSTRTALRHLRGQLDNLNITPLGIVINGTGLSEGYGQYGSYELPDAKDAHGGSRNGARTSRWPRMRQKDAVTPE